MSTSRVLDKIQKCMNLASSDNPAEAAAALRQAQKLMEKHNLTASDLSLHTVSEAEARGASRAKSLPAWVVFLRSTIGEVFGVQVMNRYQKLGGVWQNWAVFVGIGEKPQAAQYCYEVLFRQISADRNRYRKELHPRMAPRRKSRHCDLFCESWVQAVRSKVEAIAISEQDRDVIERFKEKTYGELEKAEWREQPPASSEQEIHAIRSGREAGKAAQLFRGVGTQPAPAQIHLEEGAL
ncbi:DUF7168 domain-containing protein [Vreelandella salicampi]|jgi:hypothetical protein|uniref:DUF2786 domain-containing protein n=1 Tax=Vreelandella salicampi TaxID=1449798 RepID=A0A7Z0LN12_9GAMM|nr:DUF2786 domain-containing protein [Halomonas salicampi]NYS61894.1 DUF2786 domain-containing protein [Halomonas salicampi]